MGNRILAVIMLLLLAGSLAFAGGGGQADSQAGSQSEGQTRDQTATPAPAQAPAEESAFTGLNLNGVEVLFWHNHSRVRESAVNELVNGFNNTNPYGIKVVAEYAGSYQDIYNKMISGIAGGVVPSLVVGYQNQVGAYMLADGIVDMEPYVTDPTYGLTEAEKADFIPGIFNHDYNAQFNNQRTGFPPNRSMEVLYYNADWLKELGYSAPPKTWEEFEEMARKATDPTAGTYGYAISTGASNLFSLAISRGGRGYLNASGTEYDFNQPAIADSLAFMKRLLDNGYGQKIAERYGEQTDFANRKTLFTIGSSSGLPFYANAIAESTLGNFNWSVAPIPHTTPRPVMNMYGASISIPRTTPERQLASWLFLKYMTDVEPLAMWVENSGYFPVRASVADKIGDYVSRNPQFGDAFDVMVNSDIKTEPPFASYELVRGEIAGVFNAVLDGANINSTLQDLTREAKRINDDMKP